MVTRFTFQFYFKSLFGGFNLTKNVDLDKYVHSVYGTGFDSDSEFTLSDSSGDFT